VGVKNKKETIRGRRLRDKKRAKWDSGGKLYAILSAKIKRTHEHRSPEAAKSPADKDENEYKNCWGSWILVERVGVESGKRGATEGVTLYPSKGQFDVDGSKKPERRAV